MFKITDFTRKSEMIQEVETTLRRCIALDPTDARAYVSLGKHLRLERRFEEAGRVYDDGIAVTGERLWPSIVTSSHGEGDLRQTFSWAYLRNRSLLIKRQDLETAPPLIYAIHILDCGEAALKGFSLYVLTGLAKLDWRLWEPGSLSESEGMQAAKTLIYGRAGLLWKPSWATWHKPVR